MFHPASQNREHTHTLLLRIPCSQDMQERDGRKEGIAKAGQEKGRVCGQRRRVLSVLHFADALSTYTRTHLCPARDVWKSNMNGGRTCVTQQQQEGFVKCHPLERETGGEGRDFTNAWREEREARLWLSIKSKCPPPPTRNVSRKAEEHCLTVVHSPISARLLSFETKNALENSN